MGCADESGPPTSCWELCTWSQEVTGITAPARADLSENGAPWAGQVVMGIPWEDRRTQDGQMSWRGPGPSGDRLHPLFPHPHSRTHRIRPLPSSPHVAGSPDH